MTELLTERTGTPPQPALQPAGTFADGTHAPRFSVERYVQMYEAGILTGEDHVELIDGYLVQTMAPNPPHIFLTSWLAQWLRQRLPATAHVREEKPVELDGSCPEPDLAVVRGSLHDYSRRLPTGADVLLAVEVAHTSLTLDRLKAATYAAAGIPAYLIVDVADGHLIAYSQPTETGYASEQTVDRVPVRVDQTDLGTIDAGELFAALDG